jgi:hypothetical protein
MLDMSPPRKERNWLGFHSTQHHEIKRGRTVCQMTISTDVVSKQKKMTTRTTTKTNNNDNRVFWNGQQSAKKKHNKSENLRVVPVIHFYYKLNKYFYS